MTVEGWRTRTRRVIFESDTPAGKAFDLALLVLIVASVLLVMAESVERVRDDHGRLIVTAEWIITGLFAVEYVLRLLTAEDRRRYARSFYGVIDLLAVVPPMLALAVPGARSLLVVRALRLLRIFRILRMTEWLGEANYLLEAVRASTRKIVVFLLTVLLINVIVGSVMYVIEGPEHGFDNMFLGVYWSIVTMSTVGFGDLAPGTPAGRVLASALMILGYSVIAVPTGIVSSELTRSQAGRGRQLAAPRGTRGDRDGTGSCPHCGAHGPAG